MTYETVAFYAGSIATVLFGLFFLGMLIFVFRPGATSKYEELAKTPLDDDEIKD